MSGIYNISEKLDHDTKFACMVSFNSKDPEYYDIDLPSVDLSDESYMKTIESFIDLTLQAAADSDETASSKSEEKSDLVALISVVDGKAILS